MPLVGLRALARRPEAVTLLAVGVRAGTLLALTSLAGATALASAFHRLDGPWIWAIALAELLTYPTYALAYGSIARLCGARGLDTRTVLRIVVAGFGPIAVSGGFETDRTVLAARDQSGPPGERGPNVASAEAQVAALSTLEWAILAPVTAAVALGLLCAGARVSGSLLWPWVIGVPAVAVLALWVTRTPARIDRVSHLRGRRIAVAAHAAGGVVAVRDMVRRPRRCPGAWIGMALYWGCEIAALWAALHAAGLDLDVPMAGIAYATGCLGSRRSLPLGGAGVTEALFVLSLHQLNQPLGEAVLAVILYRAFNFIVAIVPALLAYRHLTRRA